MSRTNKLCTAFTTFNNEWINGHADARQSVFEVEADGANMYDFLTGFKQPQQIRIPKRRLKPFIRTKVTVQYFREKLKEAKEKAIINNLRCNRLLFKHMKKEIDL